MFLYVSTIASILNCVTFYTYVAISVNSIVCIVATILKFLRLDAALRRAGENSLFYHKLDIGEEF